MYDKKKIIIILVGITVMLLIILSVNLLLISKKNSNINKNKSTNIREEKNENIKEAVSEDEKETIIDSTKEESVIPNKEESVTSPKEDVVTPVTPTIIEEKPKDQEPEMVPEEPVKPVEVPVITDKLLFNADFETGDLSQWYHKQSCPNRISVVNDPLNPNNKVGMYTVLDNDTKEFCSGSPTSDPRAQTLSRNLLEENGEYYISFSIFFPENFPKLTDWFGVAQVYGPPWGGSPTIGFGVSNDRIVFNSAQTSGTRTIHTTVWSGPELSRGLRWENIIVHLKMSTDPNVGFAELWYNGNKQTLFNGKQIYYFRTLDSGRNWDGKTSNILYAQQYRSKSMTLGEVSIYQDNYKIGNTYNSVK